MSALNMEKFSIDKLIKLLNSGNYDLPFKEFNKMYNDKDFTKLHPYSKCSIYLTLGNMLVNGHGCIKNAETQTKAKNLLLKATKCHNVNNTKIIKDRAKKLLNYYFPDVKINNGNGNGNGSLFIRNEKKLHETGANATNDKRLLDYINFTETPSTTNKSITTRMANNYEGEASFMMGGSRKRKSKSRKQKASKSKSKLTKRKSKTHK